MTLAKILPRFLVCFLVGIVLGCLVSVPVFYIYILTAINIIVLAVFYFKNTKALFFLVLFLAVVLGFWRAQAIFNPSQFSQSFGQEIKLNGVVISPPNQTDSLQQLTIKFNGYMDLVLVSVPKGIEYSYGDEVLVTGKLAEAKEFNGFNYAKFLQGKGVRAVMYRPQILVIKTGQANPLLSKLFFVKDQFTKRVVKLVKQPEAGVVLGMLVGSDDYISKYTKLLFQQVGLSHVLVVSGYNISLLVVCVEFLAPLVGRRFASFLGLGLILIYALIAGLGASVLRAAIMGSLLLLAWIVKRAYSIVPAILLAASVMVFFRPTLLLWDVGFQLSFAATLGIVLASPLLVKKYFFKLPEVWAQMLSVSLVAYVVTIPLLLFNFGTLSLIAPLANILILPTVPIIMALGFLVSLPVLGFGAAFLVQNLTSLVLWIMGWLSKVPFSNIPLAINLFQFLCISGLLVIGYLLILWSGSKNSPNWEKTLIE